MNNPQVTGPREASDDGLVALYKRPDFLLRRAHQISVSLFMEEAEKLDATTTTQYGILVILHSFDVLDQISPTKRVVLDRSTTGLVIKKFEDEGLIVRIEDSKDRRRKVIVLAARGRQKLKQLLGPATRAQENALAACEADEAPQFLALLDIFVKHFNGIMRAPITGE